MSDRKKQSEIVKASQEPERYGVSFFIKILETEVDPACIWYAIKAVGDLKGNQAYEQLLSVLQSPDVEFDESSVHRICAWAIGRLGSNASEGVASLLKNDMAEENRIAIIDTLGEIADPANVSMLSEELKSQSSVIRLWTALSLAKIGESSLPVLKEALGNADFELVFLIVDALAIIGTENTIPVLAEAVEKDPETVQTFFVKNPTEKKNRYANFIRQSKIAEQFSSLNTLLK